MFAYRNVQRAIRDDRWKLIRYPQVNKTQFFDLRADPFERNDLAGQNMLAGKVQDLTANLEKALNACGDKCALTVPNPNPAAWSPPAEKAPTQ